MAKQADATAQAAAPASSAFGAGDYVWRYAAPHGRNLMDDPHGLQRFVEAQNPLYPRVLSELRAGAKRSHWMWFVFPQIAGLGHSVMAQRYAIASQQEASRYLQHPVLGARLRECTHLVLAIEGRAIRDILGAPDDVKFRSSMTLFAHATADNGLFLRAIDTYFCGAFDPATLARLSPGRPAPGR